VYYLHAKIANGTRLLTHREHSWNRLTTPKLFAAKNENLLPPFFLTNK